MTFTITNQSNEFITKVMDRPVSSGTASEPPAHNTNQIVSNKKKKKYGES
jgi:hypothetical protein